MFAKHTELRWLVGGFVLTLCSGFGQTYYIALFAGHIKSALSMSDGHFGSLYMAGTLASAALLIWAGKAVDRFSTRWLGVLLLVGLALAALAVAFTTTAVLLVIALFGLRFFGQGMLTHLAMTAMARWFDAKRGRAVSLAALGLPTGEAVLPLAAVALIALVGWRGAWLSAALALVLIGAPLLLTVLWDEPRRNAVPIASEHAASDDVTLTEPPARHQWTRADVLRSPVFYPLLAITLAPPFIVTGIFFNQVTLLHSKGWDMVWFASNFPVLAGSHVLSGLATGWLVDRCGARRLLPAFLIPLGVSAGLLTYATSPSMLPTIMALLGVTLGCSSSVQGALWAELFGTAHLGAVRAMVMSVVVFASALSPALSGVGIDNGISFESQLLAAALYCALAAIASAVLVPRLDKLARLPGL